MTLNVDCHTEKANHKNSTLSFGEAWKKIKK